MIIFTIAAANGVVYISGCRSSEVSKVKISAVPAAKRSRNPAFLLFCFNIINPEDNASHTLYFLAKL